MRPHFRVCARLAQFLHAIRVSRPRSVVERGAPPVVQGIRVGAVVQKEANDLPICQINKYKSRKNKYLKNVLRSFRAERPGAAASGCTGQPLKTFLLHTLRIPPKILKKYLVYVLPLPEEIDRPVVIPRPGGLDKILRRRHFSPVYGSVEEDGGAGESEASEPRGNTDVTWTWF